MNPADSKLVELLDSYLLARDNLRYLQIIADAGSKRPSPVDDAQEIYAKAALEFSNYVERL